MNKETTDIFRTYYKTRHNISKDAEIIHNYLFHRKNSISKYGKKEANILTKFFQELKNYSKIQTNNPGEGIKKTLLGQRFEKIPILDFTKGGQGLGGIQFEEELLKLFSNVIGEEFKKNFGQMTGASYTNLGTTNLVKATEMLSEYVGDEMEKTLENVEKRIVSGADIGAAPPDALYLKVGAKRYGKIDVYANNAEISEEFVFTDQIKPGSNLERALTLLQTATFSVKSYMTSGEIHLGETDKKKAVSAVAEYVATKTGKDAARYAGIYFLHHPDKPGEGDDPIAAKQLYEHYDHMKNVYELTGIGLRYSDVEELYNVDFLLVNRASEKEIKVYSTQELVKNFEKSNKFNIS